MEETTTPKRKYVGNGRKRLSNIDMMERMVRKEMESLYKKANKKAGPGLTADDVKKLESLVRAQKVLDERAAALKQVDQEVEDALDELTPEQIREAMKDLRSKAQKPDQE
jgi:geranylgeranyl pyrophosphate synthase